MAKNRETVAKPIVPEVLPPDTQVVKGHRVRPEAEEFVLVGEKDETSLVKCPECGSKTSEAAWEENGDACPECDYQPAAPTPDEGPLSEAELLIQSVGPDKEDYSIRVDHLPNYYNDGRTDTRAVRKFCRTLRGDEVSLDYLETVRQSCYCECAPPGKEAAYSFAMFKLTGETRGFRKRWYECITKAPLKAEPIQPNGEVAPIGTPRSAMDEVKASVGIFKDVAQVLADARGPVPRQIEAPPPMDPFQTLKSSLQLIREIRENGGEGDSGSPAGTSGNSARDWLDGVANLLRSANLGPVINNVVAFSLREAERQRAAKNGTSGGATSTPPADYQTAAALGEAAAAPDGPKPAAPAPPMGPSQQPGFSIEMLPPNIRLGLERALGVVVQEIQRNEELDEYDVDTAVGAINNFITEFPVAFPLFDRFMAQPRAALVVFLGQVNSEWSIVLELDGAMGFVGELQRLWKEQSNADQPEADKETEAAGVN